MEGLNRNNQINEQQEMINVENQIRNNRFSNKEELFEYLVSLRNRGISQEILTNKKMREFLDLFDSLNKKTETPLDMQNYASVGLEDQDLIVSKQTDRVVKTLEGTSAFKDEFSQTQNEITANSTDGLANADTVFEQMANNQKEEMLLVSVVEAIERDNIDEEMLNKIKFFITNKYVNPFAFRVDIQNGVFYNMETNEVYEVRKNENTGEYEIYKGSELVYGSSESPALEEQNQELNNDPQLEHDTNEEQMSYESRYNKPKVRRLVPTDSNQYSNRAAFTKVGFLIINIVTFALLMTMIFLLNK